MTDIERKALELVNEVRAERNQDLWRDVGDRKGYGMVLEALCRAIEQHEAFRQEVSDAVEKWDSNWNYRNAPYRDELLRFIIPKPDPLVEVLSEAGYTYLEADKLRAALAKRGLEIREKSDD